MGDLEQIYFNSYVLFYADYLSLRETYTPITDNCKYYYIAGMPINCAILQDLQPVYDVQNQYYVQAYQELDLIRQKMGFEALASFVRDLCNVFALGCINGEQMLKCILCYDTSKVRKKAISKYRAHMKNIDYTQKVCDDDGNIVEEPCTKYVYHVNQAKNIKNDIQKT